MKKGLLTLILPLLMACNSCNKSIRFDYNKWSNYRVGMLLVDENNNKIVDNQDETLVFYDINLDGQIDAISRHKVYQANHPNFNFMKMPDTLYVDGNLDGKLDTKIFNWRRTYRENIYESYDVKKFIPKETAKPEKIPGTRL